MASSFSPLTIANSSLKLILLPGMGGSFRYFGAKRGDAWIELMRHTPESIGSSSDTSNFLMAPYPNRIRDGKFKFEGKEYSLRFPEKHSIHGDVRNRPWEIVSQSAETCTLALQSKAFSDINFPFPFDLTVAHSLKDNSLHTGVRLTNAASGKMPAGVGFHPYFPRRIAGPKDEVQLKFKVEGEYPTEKEIPLPVSDIKSLSAEHDFSKLREISSNFDHCFGGWDGEAQIRWPESKLTLLMRSGESARHLVLYAPPGKDFFALEPQTQMIDGFNFPSPNSGVKILAPKESLEMEFTLTVQHG